MALIDIVKKNRPDAGVTSGEQSDEFVPSKDSVRNSPSRRKDTAVLSETGVRRKRKEPLPPWTARERYLVLIILIATLMTSGVLALSARSWKLPNLPKLALPSFSLFNSDPIIIEKKDKTYPAICYDVADNTKADFTEIINKLSGVYGLYVIDLTSGFSFSVNETETFQAASLIKLPVMASLLYEDERGSLSLSDEYILDASDKVTGSGSLYGKKDGTILTYEDLVRYMGKESDNTAYKVSLKIVGQEQVMGLMNTFGMYATNINDNSTTLSDVASFFDNVWNKKTLSSDHNDMLMSFLTDTIYESWLTKGLPDDVTIAHKFGRDLHVVNDAGIVLSKRPYVIVVLSKGIVEKEADTALPEISQVVYDNMMGLVGI